MKKKVVRMISCFLVGLLVMNVLFTDSSKKASAAHSSSSTLYIAQNMEIVRATSSADNSMKSFLGSSIAKKHHAMFIKEAGKSNYTTAYCIAFDKLAKNNGTLNADMQIDETQARLINYAMLYGFNHKSFNTSSGSQTDTNNFFATQTLIWIIKAGQFYNDTNRTQLENYFFKAWPAIKTKYKEIYTNVKYQDMKPSYADTEVTLKWNSCTNKFEGSVDNTFISGQNSANKTVKVDTSTLPAGVTVDVNGEKVTIASTNEYTTAQTIKFSKIPAMKGKIVCWNVAVSSQQPQATLDYDMDPMARTFSMKVKTEAKPVVPTPTPATPQPTEPVTPAPTCPVTPQPTEPVTPAPTCPVTPQPTEPVTPAPTCPVTPQPTEAVTPVPTQEVTVAPTAPVVTPTEESEKLTVKKVTVVEETADKFDEVPSTADTSNLGKAIVLLSVSVLAMMIVMVVNYLKKKRYI